MPQDRPSMSVTAVDADDVSTIEATARTPVSEMTTPNSAVMMGSPAAISEPSVMTRMRRATINPMISGVCDIVG